MRFVFIVAGCLWISIGSGCFREAPRAQAMPSDQAGPASAESPQAGDDSTTPAANSSDSQDRDIENLIEQLIEVEEPGFGYSVSFSGSEFLPYDETGEMSTLILGAAHATRSNTLRAIVRTGAAAVPILLKHIGDDRPTKMPPVSGMMWMAFADEYDFNRHSRPTAPEGVNRDDLGLEKLVSEKEQPAEHAVTVGDLCFVALGQIVNRRFSATRYQPTGGVVVSSPTHSKALRREVLEEWSALTAESHKRLLIADFLTPDNEGRRTGAYLRLALYYPEAVEVLVMHELSRPTFDVFGSFDERARFIATLTHDDSQKVGDKVKSLFLKDSNDDQFHFAAACLRCLASRGYSDFLLEQLKKIDPMDSEGQRLQTQYIEGISTSKSPPVRARLFDIFKRSANEAYFMAALPAIDRAQDRVIADAARELLATLPADTKSGGELLRMVGDRFPDEAKEVFRSFLSVGSANRAETMCGVLWYGNPLSKEILAPLLDDKRELPGFPIPVRVCDRAAQAISHTSKNIRYNSEWSMQQKEEQIERLKQYCKEDLQ